MREKLEKNQFTTELSECVIYPCNFNIIENNPFSAKTKFALHSNRKINGDHYLVGAVTMIYNILG